MRSSAPKVRSTHDLLRRGGDRVASKIGDERDDDDGVPQQQQRTMIVHTPITIEGIYDQSKHISRLVFVTIAGTLSEFGQKTPRVRLFNHAEAVVYSSSMAPPDQPVDVGDPNRGFIVKAKVASSSSSFPCPVIWSSKRLPGRVSISPPGLSAPQKGFFVSPAATQGYKPGKCEGYIHCASIRDEVFLKKYAHAKPGVEDVGVVEVPGDLMFIPRGNPLEHIIFANQEHGQFAIKRGNFGNVEGIMVSKDILNFAKESYKSLVLPNVPLVDMLAINLSLRRAGDEWAAPLGDMPPEVFGTQFTATIGIELTYRLMLAQEIPLR